MENNTSLYKVYKDIHTNHITSIEKLKNSYPDLYERLMDSVYEYLISDEVSNAIFQSCSTYYGKAGKAETESIIQVDFIDKESMRNKHFFTKIGLKHGDLVHDYYIYLLTEVKKKGKTKGLDFFSIIFKNEDLESWIPITLSSFENWIYDRWRTTRATDSLDMPINSDSNNDDYTLASLISDSTISTPGSIFESKVVTYDILNDLAKESLGRHPEWFIALDWILFSCNNGMYKPTDLYNKFTEILTEHSVSEATQLIISDTLNDLSTLGLDTAMINHSIDLRRVSKLLENIKAIADNRSKEYLYTLVDDSARTSCLKVASENERKVITNLSHWLERARRSFQKNKTVLAYK